MSKPPVVVDAYVEEVNIVVGTSDWYAWLETIPSFHYECSTGKFTARKYSNYWNAYRRIWGKFRQEYLGKTSDLSVERMQQVATKLALPVMQYEGKRRSKPPVIESVSITDNNSPSPALADALNKISKLEAELKRSQERIAELEEIAVAAQEVVKSMATTNMTSGKTLPKLRDILREKLREHDG
jgi:hypothetical protein